MVRCGKVWEWDMTDMWQGGINPSPDELVASPRFMCQGLAVSPCQAWVASWHAFECVCHVRLEWNCSWTALPRNDADTVPSGLPLSPDGVSGKFWLLSLPSDFSQLITSFCSLFLCCESITHWLSSTTDIKVKFRAAMIVFSLIKTMKNKRRPSQILNSVYLKK